jgi:hypothetical protein
LCGVLTSAPPQMPPWTSRLTSVSTPDTDYDTINTNQVGRTLLAGDLIGANGQLLMLSAADATLDANASATLSLVNRLRSSVASGAAVTWDKPTAAFRMLSNAGMTYDGMGVTQEVQCTLGEAVS